MYRATVVMAKIKKKRIAYVSIMTVHSRQIEMCTHAHGAMWELAPESIEQTHTHTQVVRTRCWWWARWVYVRAFPWTVRIGAGPSIRIYITNMKWCTCIHDTYAYSQYICDWTNRREMKKYAVRRIESGTWTSVDAKPLTGWGPFVYGCEQRITTKTTKQNKKKKIS